MNTQSINKAFDIINKRRTEAISNYEKRIEEIEKNIPEISYLNQKMANTSRNVIFTALKQDEDIKSKISEIKRANIEAQRRTAEILRTHGYPANYLDIQYFCFKCCDTGYKNNTNEYCDCVTKLVNQINSDYVNKNSHLQLYTFESFEVNTDYYSPNELTSGKDNISKFDNMKIIYDDCVNYANKFKPSFPSVLMMGRTGLGKTHLSLSIAKTVLERGYSVIYTSAMDMFSTIEREKFTKYNSSSDTLESILNTELLIIDDLGVEIDNKFYKSVLYNIINTRYTHTLATIITTNCSIDDLNQKYEQRITSRLLSYESMMFYGKDVRAIKAYIRKKFDYKNADSN